MLQFNARLLSCVPILIGKDVETMSKSLPVGRDTIHRAIAAGDMKLTLFVEICNTFRIDYTPFFIEDGTDYMPSSILVSKSKWTPITIVEENLKKRGFSLKSIKVSTTAMIMGMDPETAYLEGGGQASADQLRQPKHSIRNARSEKVAELEPEVEETDGKWKYNIQLMKMLPSLLRIANGQIGIRCGHSPSMWQRIADMGDVQMSFLTDICNEFRIPVDYFFEEGIPSQLQVSEEEWEPYTFHGEYVKHIPDVNNPQKNINIKAIAECLDLDKRTISNIAKEDGRAWLSTIIDICNTYGVSPMYFYGSDKQYAATYTNAWQQQRIEKLEDTIDRLRKANQMNESKIRHLEELIKMKE